MGKPMNIRMQFGLALAMFLASIFMSISYYIKISAGEADRLTTIAFYVWIFSIVAWLIKVMHDIRVLRQTKDE